jgi:group I intron endonuclease
MLISRLVFINTKGDFMSGIIYKLTSPNGKCYIGQTWDFEKRIKYYKSYSCTNQIKLLNALKKYKFEKFSTEIMEEGIEKQEEMDTKEKYFIKLFDSIENGYNLTEGGKGGKMSEETKLKMSISHKGKKFSEEHKSKISKSNRGKIITEEQKQALREYRTGKITKEETKIKIRESSKKTWELKGEDYKKDFGKNVSMRQKGVKFSDERKKAISLSKKGKPAKNRIRININGIIYNSIKEASISLGVSPTTIHNRLKTDKLNYFRVF